MHLTQFIRDRTDEQLTRLANVKPEHWDPTQPILFMGTGCLLCHTFQCETLEQFYQARKGDHGEYWGDFPYDRSASYDHYHTGKAEEFYMDLSNRNGREPTGAMVSRLARRELGRRALAAVGELHPAEREAARA